MLLMILVILCGYVGCCNYVPYILKSDMNKEHATNGIYSTRAMTRATKFRGEAFTKTGVLHLIQAWTGLK
jgi:hypothetical protein